MINEDWLAPRPVAYRSHLNESWVPVRAIFSELHERFMRTRGGHRVAEGELMRCLYFTCVRPDARRQGVMGGLWAQTINVARERGYETITAQASTDDTRRALADELGFTQVAGVSFADFVMPEDEAAACGLTGKVFAELLDKSPKQYGGGLTIHSRRVPSNLYV
jgi:hypothetical protein